MDKEQGDSDKGKRRNRHSQDLKVVSTQLGKPWKGTKETETWKNTSQARRKGPGERDKGKYTRDKDGTVTPPDLKAVSPQIGKTMDKEQEGTVTRENIPGTRTIPSLSKT